MDNAPSECSVDILHDEILVSCKNGGSSSCPACGTRVDELWKSLITSMQNTPIMQVAVEVTGRKATQNFSPPPCPYCDLDIAQLDCTCFDYGN